jgi:transcriptional regulator CtsR
MAVEMRSLVSAIEAYLKELLKSSPEGWIEVRRRDIAEQFDCVPSQITYVVNTRFDTRHGYLVESRRGGGGCIKICSLFLGGEQTEREEEREQGGEQPDPARAALYSLARRGIFSQREYLLLNLVFQVVDGSLAEAEAKKLKEDMIRQIIAEIGLA